MYKDPAVDPFSMHEGYILVGPFSPLFLSLTFFSPILQLEQQTANTTNTI